MLGTFVFWAVRVVILSTYCTDRNRPWSVAPLYRRCTMSRLYKAELVCSRPIFHARSDSEVAWAPYPIDFASPTRFVETKIRHILHWYIIVVCRYFALCAINKSLVCSFIDNRRWCRVLGLLRDCSLADSHRVGTIPTISSVSNSDHFYLWFDWDHVQNWMGNNKQRVFQ